MAKNLFGKTVKVDNAYATYRVDNPLNGMYFEWKVLKAWQGRDKEDTNPYARWFCAVKSPMTNDSWEMGDVYASEVKDLAQLVEATDEWKQYEKV